MYHHLKKINCPALNKLNQLARVALSFGLEQESHASKTLIRHYFIQHCANQGFPEAGEWLWRKNTISNPLYALIQIPVPQKQAILPAYVADTDLEYAFHIGKFAYYSIPKENKPALALVDKIMKSFYTSVLASPNGVDAKVLNEPENLTRQTVLRAFILEQEGILMMVCPGCDGAPPEQEADGTIREDVDHFFPKSRYPFLTIHPLNLTPYCKHCNQDYKKAKDPLRAKNGQPSIDLGGIFHPYIHSVRDDKKNSEVQVFIKRDKNSVPHVNILPINNDPHQVTCHQSLEHLLKLESRWDGALQGKQTIKPIKMLLVSLLSNEPNKPFIPSMAWILEKLPIIEQTVENGIGESERHVAAHAYAQWMKADIDAQNEWLEKLILYTT